MMLKSAKVVCSLVVATTVIAASFVGVSPVKAASLTIVQSVMGNIFYENDAKTFNVQTDGASVDWSYTDYWGSTVESGTVPVSAGSAVITVSPNKYGWFQLLVKVKDSSGAVITQTETSFAVVSNFDLNQVTSSHFSVQTHAARTDGIAQDASVLLPIAKKLGVKSVRDSFRWSDIEDTTKGIYNFKSFHNNFMNTLTANNLSMIFTAALNNPLYDNGNFPTSTEALTAYANYAKAAFQRYPSQNKWMEVWNEPDIKTFTMGLTPEQRPGAYFELLKATYPVVKNAAPNLPIIGGVVASTYQANATFPNTLFSLGGLSYMDQFSFHNYNTDPNILAIDITDFNNRIRFYNNNVTIPMDMTENGISTANFSEEFQAYRQAQKTILGYANGLNLMSSYNLQDKLYDPTNVDNSRGLVRNPKDPKGAYVPKKAFSTYAALTRQLSNTTFGSADTISNSSIASYTFTKGTDTIRTMWTTDGSTQGVSLHTNSPLMVSDIMGNSRMHTPINGVVQLTLNQNIQYIKGNITRIPPNVSTGTVITAEVESLPTTVSSGDSHTLITGTTGTYSGTGADKLSANAVDDYVTYAVYIPQPGAYDIKVKSILNSDRGTYQLVIDGTNVGSRQDEYRSSSLSVETDLGNYYFGTAGNKEFKFQVVGKNASSSGYTLLLDYVKLTKLSVDQDIIVDNTDSGATFNATFHSKWSTSDKPKGYYGTNYAHYKSTAAGQTSWAMWTPDIPLEGDYKLYMWWPSGPNRADAAPLIIQYGASTDTGQTVNQKVDGGMWNLIGTYHLTPGTGNFVKITGAAHGFTIADAVKFEWVH
ncbi:golvesin C-terminal-like domain-containing protein [Paenibacillus germinis]|nr:family 1 glycosylhydrolase [Paenibacillus germinis]